MAHENKLPADAAQRSSSHEAAQSTESQSGEPEYLVGNVLRPAVILRLQKTIGNRATQRLLAQRQAATVTRRTSQQKLQRFEAPMHEASERVGLTTDANGQVDNSRTALSNEEASAVYFGNWMRDMNQAFVPMLRNMGVPNDVLFGALSYIAAKKFGREMTPEQFGYYIPAEHIDSPAGLTTQDDVLGSQPAVTNTARGQQAAARPSAYDTAQEPLEPGAQVAPGASLFDVDQSGVIAFMRRTNRHVERRLELAAQRGRNPDGMMHFGAALHAVEDLFAHSNYIEIAVQSLLSREATLLPQLGGHAREVFNFSTNVEVQQNGQPQTRPVLLTGSFTSTDTQVSIASEIVGILGRPLSPPQGNAETRSETQFVETLLRGYDQQVRSNPQFRQQIRAMLTGAGVPGLVVDNVVLNAPLADIYHITSLLGPIIPESVRIPLQTAIRNFISQNILMPLGARVQADSLDARIASTNLMNVQQQAEQTAASPTATPVQRQSGQRHAANLHNTPAPTVAGPSHSQIAKDHGNSPFFGIGFALAAEAVRRLRLKMVAAWDSSGAASQRFDFGSNNFPAQAPQGANSTQTDGANNARDLYHQRRPQRSREWEESRHMGQEIIRDGGLGTAYNLEAMRRDSRQKVRQVATAFRQVASAPGTTAGAAGTLRDLLTSSNSTRLQSLGQRVATVQAGARDIGDSQVVQEMNSFAGRLDTVADEVGAAVTLEQRQTAHEHLDVLIGEIVASLRTSRYDQTFKSAALGVLDEQSAYTQVAYTAMQRDTLAAHGVGGAYNSAHRDPNLPNNPQQYQVVNLTAPALDRGVDGQTRNPAVQDLIAESRLIFNHPYDNRWWEDVVRRYITAHPDRIAQDIAARNTGVAFMRRPGERGGDGHSH